MFIVFEGVDGSGKSTQMKLMSEHLKGRYGNSKQVVTGREPGSTRLGESIRDLALTQSGNTPKSEALLMMASRNLYVTKHVIPSLARGDIFLSDRFSMSTIVYQGYAQYLDCNMLEHINHFATNGLKPDLYFVFDIDKATYMKRRNRNMRPWSEGGSGSFPSMDQIERHTLERFDGLRCGYLSEASLSSNSAVVIDGRYGIMDVHQKCTIEFLKWERENPGHVSLTFED